MLDAARMSQGEQEEGKRGEMEKGNSDVKVNEQLPP